MRQLLSRADRDLNPGGGKGPGGGKVVIASFSLTAEPDDESDASSV